MPYSITSLRSPSSRLARAAGVRPVFNPPSRPGYSGQAPPSYDQQLGQLRGSNAAPNFFSSSADGGGGGGGGTPPAPRSSVPSPSLGFSNSSNPAFSMGLPSVGGQGTINGVTFDYGSDPILQQAQAAAQAQIAQAEAAALGGEKTALVRYGDPSLVRSVLGSGYEDVEKAAKGNAFSTVAELGRWNDRSLSGIDTATNRNNLYFSSTRARDRALQEEDLTRQTASTGNQLQDLLTNIAQGLLQTKQGAISGLLSAGESAYGRALQAALAQMYAYQPPQAGGGGGGGGTPSTSPYIANTPPLGGTPPPNYRIWY